jgi:hypothetical protein
MKLGRSTVEGEEEDEKKKKKKKKKKFYLFINLQCI